MRNKKTTATTQPDLSNLCTISQYVARRNANNLGGKKLYEPKVRQLIADGIIKTIEIAGKHFIDWAQDGDLEIDGPVVSIQRVAAQKERREDNRLTKAINRLVDIAEVIAPARPQH